MVQTVVHEGLHWNKCVNSVSFQGATRPFINVQRSSQVSLLQPKKPQHLSSGTQKIVKHKLQRLQYSSSNEKRWSSSRHVAKELGPHRKWSLLQELRHIVASVPYVLFSHEHVPFSASNVMQHDIIQQGKHPAPIVSSDVTGAKNKKNQLFHLIPNITARKDLQSGVSRTMTF